MSGVVMQAAIQVLNRSIENVKSELLGVEAQLDALLIEKHNHDENIKFLKARLKELENALSQIQGKPNVKSTSKAKKTKS